MSPILTFYDISTIFRDLKKNMTSTVLYFYEGTSHITLLSHEVIDFWDFKNLHIRVPRA
jgi:TRAP-type C4-dicarboxylate transport system substrate-binding protein